MWEGAWCKNQNKNSIIDNDNIAKIMGNPNQVKASNVIRTLYIHMRGNWKKGVTAFYLVKTGKIIKSYRFMNNSNREI